MSLRIALIAAALLGCEATGGGGGASSGAVKLTESGTQRGSAGGFATTLGQELGAPEGTLGAAAPGAPLGAAAGSAAPAATGSAAPAATAAPTATGSAAPTATGSAAATATAVAAPGGSAAAAGSGAAATGSAATGPAAAASSGAAAAGSAATGPAAATATTGSAAPAGAQGSAAATKVAAGSASAPTPGGAAPTGGAMDVAVPAAGKGKRVYVKPAPDIAAIKFDLEPNWERDVGEAGTFSLVVKVPNGNDTRVFAVRYGYDDQTAPVDCDQYRKFLEEKKTMVPTLNRQRSGACYVESASAFRYMINYGGKRLLCQGSLYKDAASASLGDLRDKVLMQAKKICETLAL